MRPAFRGAAGGAIHPQIGRLTGFPRDCETGDRAGRGMSIAPALLRSWREEAASWIALVDRGLLCLSRTYSLRDAPAHLKGISCSRVDNPTAKDISSKEDIQSLGEVTSMPYATNNGVRIYYEVEGAGPPLILHHGSFGSGEDWRELGYTESLKHEYRLILLDARGHGASDKPHDPAAYDLELRAGDVTAVLDDLGIQRAHFFGYSMGGWIGFGLAKYAPSRFYSLILGGAHPYAESAQGFRDILSSGRDKFISSLTQAFGPYMTPAMSERLLANDLVAGLALSQDRADLSSVLPTMTMPCLIFVGEADPRLTAVGECAKQIGKAAFFSLPACGHVAALGRSDLVLPHVTAFLTKTR